MLEFEKRGVPTVSFTAEGFRRDAHRSAESFGLPRLPLAVMPEPFTNHSPESIRAMVENGLDQVVAGLTNNVPSDTLESEITLIDDEWLIFRADDPLHALAGMNERFLEYGWGDGFPLQPPTELDLERMLAATTRGRQDTVAILEPGFGIATVEKIAANAVMAGCRPEHLPVVIAAVECLAEPKMQLRNMAMSTGPHAPLVLVNGPIRSRIGLNSGMCVLGPGGPSFANTVIGRALRLCMMNVGHTYPGVSDMDTIGTPAKYSLCAAENEEASPWSPYHVEHGFEADTSTVTVHFNYGLCDLYDFYNWEPDRLIEVFASAANNVGILSTGLWLIGRRTDPRNQTEQREHYTLFIAPEHARIFGSAGWSKDDVKQAMYRKARLPFRTLMLNKNPAALSSSHPELAWLWDSQDTMLPILEQPDCYEILVVGAPVGEGVGRGTLFYGAGGPVTKAIEE
jgi:hypothetical protein